MVLVLNFYVMWHVTGKFVSLKQMVSDIEWYPAFIVGYNFIEQSTRLLGWKVQAKQLNETNMAITHMHDKNIKNGFVKFLPQ